MDDKNFLITNHIYIYIYMVGIKGPDKDIGSWATPKDVK